MCIHPCFIFVLYSWMLSAEDWILTYQIDQRGYRASVPAGTQTHPRAACCKLAFRAGGEPQTTEPEVPSGTDYFVTLCLCCGNIVVSWFASFLLQVASTETSSRQRFSLVLLQRVVFLAFHMKKFRCARNKMSGLLLIYRVHPLLVN